MKTERWIKMMGMFLITLGLLQPGSSFAKPLYTTNDLWLQVVGATNAITPDGTAHLVINTPWNVTNGIYDLFATTNPAPRAWQWVMRTAAGQTNLTVTGGSGRSEFFILGTMLMANDGSGLTVAYENLVGMTRPISITYPANNAVIVASQTNLTLSATAAGGAGTITQVQFFQGTTSLGIVSNAPYNLIWSNAPAGNYGLTATALDNNGQAATSSVVNITITPLFATNTMKLWLKADSVTGLTDNAAVATWYDNSGWSNNATQGSTVHQPAYVANSINGYPIVRFNSANSQYFNLPGFMGGLTGAEAFVVLKVATNYPSSPSGFWHMGHSYYGGLVAYPNTDGSISDDFGSGNLNNVGIPPQSLTQYHVYEVSAQNGNWSAWINGVLLGQTDNTFGFNGRCFLGGSGDTGGNGPSSYFNGDMAEVLIFSRALTASERTTVSSYLNGKYALAPAVPATPSDVLATAISPTQIGLTWNEAYNGVATQISIERSTASNGVFTVVAQLANALSYVDTNLTAETKYYYRVRAINVTQSSGYSGVAWATTLTSGTSLPLESLALWLKADSGLAQIGTNTPVPFWADQSGNSNNATQFAASEKPMWVPGAIGDRPVVRFNSANSQYFNLPGFMGGLTGAEAFVVLKVATNYPSSPSGFWHMGNSYYGGLVAYPNTDGSISDDFGSGNLNNVGDPTQSLTQYHVYEVSAQNGNWSAWINGVLLYQADNTFGFNGRCFLGGSGDTGGNSPSSYFNGDMAEVLIFNRALTGDEREAVGSYLKQKYALVSSMLPTVSLTSPTNGAVFTSPANILLNATTSSGSGTIASVEFFSGGTNSLGVVTHAPYSLTWSNVLGGVYSLTARATDNLGEVTNSTSVSITVSNPPPVVTISSPTNNALFQALATIPLTVNAGASNGTVVKVDYYYSATNLIGESTASPFSLVWSNVAAGTNLITAKATDSLGSSTVSSAVKVIVNAQPSVSITNPVNNATFNAGANITIQATASDSDGSISKVDFYYSNTNHLIGTDTSAPYSIVLNNAPFGTYPLIAKATDNRGGVTISSPAMVSVSTNLSDSADSYVRDGSYSNSNYGSANSLLVQTNGTAGNNCNGYFKFDTRGITNITSAKLNIYAAVSAAKDTVGVSVYGTSTNWTEPGITWSNRPALGTVLGTTNISGNSYVWYVLDVTSYVQAQKAAGTNVISLAIHATNATSWNVTINSKEAGSNRPFMQIYVSNN